MEVDLADLIHHILVIEGDKAEAPVSVGHLVIGQHGLLNLGELLKVGLEKKRLILRSGLRSKTTLTSSRLVVADRPPTKIFLVLITNFGFVLRGTATWKREEYFSNMHLMDGELSRVM